MPGRMARVLRWEVWMAVFLLVSPACTQASSPAGQRTSTPASTTATTPTVEQSQATEDTQRSIEECEALATEIPLGSPVTSEIVGHDQPPPEQKYFCVHVPDGVSIITFELAETTSDLNLYVGHPDLETVQQGGVWFWFSRERGVKDKVVVVEPALAEYVNPGSYYIEVSAEDFRGSSPFTLTVRTQ